MMVVFIYLKGTIKSDKLRDEFMNSLNLKIIRFTNDEVCENGEEVVRKLKEVITLLTTG